MTTECVSYHAAQMTAQLRRLERQLADSIVEARNVSGVRVR